jgi:hypothetical protein
MSLVSGVISYPGSSKEGTAVGGGTPSPITTGQLFWMLQGAERIPLYICARPKCVAYRPFQCSPRGPIFTNRATKLMLSVRYCRIDNQDPISA